MSARPLQRSNWRRPRLSRLTTGMALCVCASSMMARHTFSAEVGEWKLSPYKVHVTFALDDAARPEPLLAEAVAKRIAERVSWLIEPLWDFELVPAADP